MLLVVLMKKQFYNTGCTTSLFIPYTRNEHNSFASFYVLFIEIFTFTQLFKTLGLEKDSVS